MRPLAILNGIILGSCSAIMLGLGVTLLVYLILLDDYPQRLGAELVPLIKYTAVFVGMTALAAGGFMGQVMNKRWKWWAEALLVLGLLGVIYYFLVLNG